MQQAVDRFVSRAAEEDFIAVVDDDGEHGARWLLEQARQLAGAPTGPGAGGTLMVQAQNSWRTVAAALTAGLGDGVLALVNRHTTRSEFAAAVDLADAHRRTRTCGTFTPSPTTAPAARSCSTRACFSPRISRCSSNRLPRRVSHA